MNWGTARNWLLGSRLARGVVDALFRRRSRRRLCSLDALDPAAAQAAQLRGLIHRAQSTRVGREHDFPRIRSEDDFRRLVQLRTPAEFWRQFGVPFLPRLDNALWPGSPPYLATCETATGTPVTPLPVTADLVAAHREALLNALAFVVHARPEARLLSGSLLLIGGGAALTPLLPSWGHDNLEEMVMGQLPALLRPFAAVAPYSGEASLRSLAEKAPVMPVTCLVANAGRLKRLWSYLQWWTGKEQLIDVWPGLQAVLFSRGPADPDRQQLERLVGTPAGRAPVLFLEGQVRPEAVWAVEDPRFGAQRVLPNHGAYFEFVPVDDLGSNRPRRLGLGQIEPGVSYALAVTSPAFWGCLVGVNVTFARVEPPLIQSVEVSALTLRTAEALAVTMEGSAPSVPAHPRTAGTPAGPARRISRNPWSARADQG